MSSTTKIEWTDRTWNPISGCTKVSAGCDNCYAEGIAERFRGGPAFPNGFDVQLRPNKLTEPLSWRKPAMVFVNSMSDLFHSSVPDEFIAQVWATMALAPQHTFQVLTKRHGRMRSLLDDDQFIRAVWNECDSIRPRLEQPDPGWPLPNVWLGVSTEDQRWADIRIPALLATPAAVRFISAEPLLGPIELEFVHYFDTNCSGCSGLVSPSHEPSCGTEPGRHWGIDWVIVGGESGSKARPMHRDWARSLRDQCVAAGVPFHFKQWGEWAPIGPDDVSAKPTVQLGLDGRGTYYANRHRPDVATLARVGKKTAGRILDGRTWDEFPAVTS